MAASRSKTRLQLSLRTALHRPRSLAGLVSMSEWSARTCEHVDEELNAAAGHEGDRIGAGRHEGDQVVAAGGSLGDHHAVQQAQQRVSQRPPRSVVQERRHVRDAAEGS